MKRTSLTPDAATAVMLSGSATSADSPMSAAVKAMASETIAATEHQTVELIERFKAYSRAGNAAKALIGINLLALRTYYLGSPSPKGGRPKKTSDNLTFSWDSYLADKFGITRETASVWIKIGQIVQAETVSKNLDLRAVCEKLPWDWTAEEAARFDQASREAIGNRTQRELFQTDFLSSLGYVNKQDTHGTNNPLGKNGSDKKKPAKSPKQLLAESQEAARKILFGTAQVGRVDNGSPAMFMLQMLNTEGRELEALPQKEMRDFYELTLKPFSTLIRKLAGL